MRASWYHPDSAPDEALFIRHPHAIRNGDQSGLITARRYGIHESGSEVSSEGNRLVCTAHQLSQFGRHSLLFLVNANATLSNPTPAHRLS
ncbi:hypothetical protein NSPZN2_10306 [Nitrospira defluvii]|uniref:Uncharacterized protein n=1 Tax=Nitrospira defluvii TaxID=330214 RepID=A0ABN7KGY3_9BACT|nr:hypothetical protein NSPZN2_10306 [Nitrospira defluvii]